MFLDIFNPKLGAQTSFIFEKVFLPVCNTTQYTYKTVTGRQAGTSSVMLPMFYKTQVDFKARIQEMKPRLSAFISRFESDMTQVQSRCLGPPSKLHFTFQVAEMNCRILKSLNLPLPYHQAGMQPSLQWTAGPEL